ncbi:MAG TPA: chemotaxis response regulator protein-glutamate methylesterase [Gemmatimonadales bacterium]|nr:chemotaxis response regulator protein-glutamate methylesterase [Gemmatimonadales bacterium]
MPSIRVLVVDDSVVVRRLVSDALKADSRLEVVGVAANGRIGLQKIPQVNPDVVTMDIEMPVLDGLATLKELRRTWPRLPVIMFSTLTERGAEATLEALSLGASDYVTKPANVGSVSLAQERIRDELVPRILALSGKVVLPMPSRPAPAPAAPVRVVRPLVARPEGVDVVAIGVSTGGPNALAKVLPALPAEFPVPIVIVQHMPPLFTKFLADRLSSASHLKVQEGRAGAVLEPGTVWIAPGNYHMVVERTGDTVRLAMNQEPQENSCRPSVDVLFRSVAEAYGSRSLSVVLTGMGQDGLRGAQLLVDAGAAVLAQDEATSVVWGMPGFIANAGLASAVLPIDAVAAELCVRTATGALQGRAS